MSFFKRIFFQAFWHAKVMSGIVLVALGVIFMAPKVIISAGEVGWPFFGAVWTSNQFFHLLHFLHIAFASFTSFLTMRQSQLNFLVSLLLSISVPVVFCTLSDIVLPFLGAWLVGVEMKLHLCLICNADVMFFFILTGILSSIFAVFFIKQRDVLNLVNMITHGLHAFFGVSAALVYMTGFGFSSWANHFIYVFILMMLAVVLPCIASDFILPQVIVNFLGIKSEQVGCCKGHE